MVTEVFMFLTQDKLVVSSYEIITHVFEPWACSYFPIVLKMDYSLFIINYLNTNILHTFSLRGSTISLLIKTRRCNL